MTSNRPTEPQTTFEAAKDGTAASGTPEPQRGQSVLADMKTIPLDAISETLMEQIVDERNMEQAWRKVKANRGGAGPDGVTLDEFFRIFPSQWPTVRQQLLDGTYEPSPARRKSILKPDGSERHLGIPNVQDRLIQQAILQVLTPIFDPGFSESSFGFRPNRSAQGAAKQVQAHIRTGYRHCVDMDLSKFFDRVQHDVLLARVAQKVHDKRLLRLIGRYLRAGVMDGVDLQPSVEGTMQGGPLSPLLANILLDDFDKELERRGLRFVRYADDFLVFTKTSQAARRVYASVGRYLTRKLKLVVNRQKSRTCSTDGVEFLGFIFLGYGGQIRISPKNIKKFKDRIRQITRRKRGVSMAYRYQELRRYLQGWMGYFSLVPAKGIFSQLDMWIRHRIRSCYWQQWRQPRTRVAMLRKLGVHGRKAVKHGSSSKGPWVSAKTEAMHIALSNDRLRNDGLVSLEELWNKFAPKWRIA
ncbi:MAG: group II intron reverse transcriptase/maturase [Nitrospira sp.]|nr:group II intron reverse transcriptase/maturase [Nitrospira sp.]